MPFTIIPKNPSSELPGNGVRRQEAHQSPEQIDIPDILEGRPSHVETSSEVIPQPEAEDSIEASLNQETVAETAVTEEESTSPALPDTIETSIKKTVEIYLDEAYLNADETTQERMRKASAHYLIEASTLLHGISPKNKRRSMERLQEITVALVKTLGEREYSNEHTARAITLELLENTNPQI